MRRTVITLLLFASSAAAAVAQPAKQSPSVPALRTGRCVVGVISHLGEKFKVSEAGLPAKVSEVSVYSWRLDDLVVDKIRDALGRRAAVQRVPYRKEALALFERPPRNDEPPLFRLFRFHDYAAEFRDATHTLLAGTRCARYVIVTPGVESLGDSGSLEGLGVGKGLGLVGMHVVIKVSVIDGETFKVLRAQVMDATRQSFPGIFGTAHPELLLNESFWPDPPNSAAQNAKLREATREMVAQCLDRMLPKLALTP